MVLSLTQENAVDLHNVSLTLAKPVGGKYINQVKNRSVYHCIISPSTGLYLLGVSFITKPKVKFSGAR